MNTTEQLVEDILEDRIKITDLEVEQMEAVIDFMREHVGNIDDEEYRDALMVLVDAIEISAENRFVADAAGDWADTIEASVAGGSTYFELEQYTLH